MKVAFVNAGGSLAAESWLPLGAVQLCTILAREHDVEFWDEERWPVDEAAVRRADVICLSGMSHQRGGVTRWLERARAWERPVLVGGVHAWLRPDDFPGAVVVAGPGEAVIADLVNDPRPERARVLRPPCPDDPDRFPAPDRARFGWARYGESWGGRPAIRVLGGYGCPYGCRFCCNRALSGGRSRLRSPAAIGEEVRRARAELGITAVVFAMSVFTLDRRWALALCEELRPLGVTWKATTRVDRIDGELLRAMREAGCDALGFGVESGDDGILRILNKGIRVEQVRTAFALAREAEVPTFALFMTHVPGETPDTLARTRRLATELAPPLGATFQRFSPLPGSVFWDEMEQWGEVTLPQADAFGPVGFVPWGMREDAPEAATVGAAAAGED